MCAYTDICMSICLAIYLFDVEEENISTSICLYICPLTLIFHLYPLTVEEKCMHISTYICLYICLAMYPSVDASICMRAYV